MNRLFSKLISIVDSFFAIIISLIVILLTPLVYIRIGRVEARLGHFLLDIEHHLCEMDADLSKKRKTLDIYFYEGRACNTQLLKMWKRIINIYSAFVFIGSIIKAKKILECLPFGSGHIINTSQRSSTVHSLDDLFVKFSPHIYFEKPELTLGQSMLHEMGVEGEFVCFHARDRAFLSTAFPKRDWSYHDYLDADIDNYLLATENLAKRGLFCLRMGKIVAKPLLAENRKIIDYASEYQSDFMDIYLSSQCKFFIVGNSGIHAIPMMFKKPRVRPNIIPLYKYVDFGDKEVFIPKLLKRKKENRFLTFEESMNLTAEDITELVRRSELEILENSSEEIKDLVLEMNDRLDEKWKETGKDEKLQQAFWSVVESPKYRRPPGVRIGTKFLKKYRELW